MTPPSPPAAPEPTERAHRAGGFLWELSAVEMARRVRAGEVTAVELVEAHLERIGQVEPALHAFVRLDRQGALERAERLDREGAPAEGGGLWGVPIAVKDNLSLADRPLSCGSKILEGFVAPTSATAVARLLGAGAVPVGQTNLDELAMGTTTETSVHGPTRNPWAPDRVPGGSSGGSAAAVAAGAVPLALGSDTGGSVRQPAALCGVVGLKPTWGRVSRSGLVAHAASFDTVGFLARTVADGALALQLTEGPDPADASLADGYPALPRALSRPALGDLPAVELRGVRVAVPAPEHLQLPGGAAERCFRQSLETLETLGAQMVEVPIPLWEAALGAYLALSSAEAVSQLARFDGLRYGRGLEPLGAEADRDRANDPLAASVEERVRRSRSAALGPGVQRRILLGGWLLEASETGGLAGGDPISTALARARSVRAALTRDLAELFRRVDVLATPTTPGGAGPLGRLGDAPEDLAARLADDRYTVAASLAGLPALSVPCGFDDDGLPLGLQLMGPAFGEAVILEVGAGFERAVGKRMAGAYRPSAAALEAPLETRS